MQLRSPKIRIGELLVGSGIIKAEVLEFVLLLQKFYTGIGESFLLGELLIQLGYVHPQSISSLIAEQSHGVGISPNIDNAPDELFFEEFPFDLARKYSVLPISIQKGVTIVATASPHDDDMVDTICRELNRKSIETVYAPLHGIIRALDLYEMKTNPLDFVELLTTVRISGDVTRLCREILHQAVLRQATDIHFDPAYDFAAVLFRVDGSLEPFQFIPLDLYEKVLSFFKQESKMDEVTRLSGQDGQFSEVRYGNQRISYRLAVVPVRVENKELYSEKLTIRVLDPLQLDLDLDQLGFHPSMLVQLRELINQTPNGIVVIAGPTGSGKSTTIYSLLQEMDTIHRKALSIEDPVERTLMNVEQVELMEGKINFESALSFFMRHDPDIVFVGEVRSKETAQAAIRLARTGHLVLTTLHANDSAAVVARLRDIDTPSNLIADTGRVFLSQRLLPVICTHCAEKEPPRSEHRLIKQRIRDINAMRKEGAKERGSKDPFHIPSGFSFKVGTGCENCKGKGVRKRTVIAEMLLVSPKMEVLLEESPSTSQVRQLAIEEGMVTMEMSALWKLSQGMISSEQYISAGFIKNIK